MREAASAQGRVLTAYDAPDAYHWNYAESDGIRFQGSSMFQGENRSGGARMSYTLQRDTADKELKKSQVAARRRLRPERSPHPPH